VNSEVVEEALAYKEEMAVHMTKSPIRANDECSITIIEQYGG